ncbi:MAG TPA: carboxypeptidase-like regulatory domain-containing protein [Bryobacteraceae bacterium]|nr:carboxypeptidase-like regulatory domain-containing protein [Bryobacteraceae bacterium]
MAGTISRVVFLLAILPAIAAAQDGGKSASLDGVVINSTTGDPLPRARVRLIAFDTRGGTYGALTGDDGRFALGSIQPGKYTIQASLRGFLDAQSPQHVECRPESATHDVRLQLAPEGVIGGRVLDSRGEPVQAARVLAQSINWLAFVETDDRGEFLLTELRAGRYFLRAQLPQNDDPAEIRTDGTKEEWYGPTWYPNSRSKSEAAAVDIAPGAEIDGIEIRLVKIPIVRVAGTVTGAPPGLEFSVHAFDQQEDNRAYASVRNGKFVFWRLPPGHYTISALTQSPDGRRLAAVPVPVDVADSNVDNLTLALIPEFEIAGQIEWDGTPPSAESLRAPAVRIAAPSLEEDETSRENGKIAEDGSFRVAHVTVGKQRVALAGMPENVYVKSLHLGTVEMPEARLDLDADPKDARLLVVLSTAGAEVSGIVKNGRESPKSAEVCLAPDRADAGCERQMLSGEDGRFLFRGLAPGKYRLSIDGLDNSTQTLELHEGEKATQDLRTGK